MSQLSKKSMDWLGIIAIVLMLVACGFLYFEQKACKDPFKNIIDKELVGDELSYSYAEINLYANVNSIVPLKKIPIYLDLWHRPPSSNYISNISEK